LSAVSLSAVLLHWKHGVILTRTFVCVQRATNLTPPYSAVSHSVRVRVCVLINRINNCVKFYCAFTSTQPY
jgi:hypothetical protein